MTKAISAETMKRLEYLAESEYGIRTLILMENAGRSVADRVIEYCSNKGISQDLLNPKILILCGKGNNGGDGFVTARHLVNRGLGVSIIFYGELDDLKEDSKINYNVAVKMKITIHNNPDMIFLKSYVNQTDIIVDALFGTGLARELDDKYIKIVKCVNESIPKVISIDIPSGLNADEGTVMGDAIKADLTVSLGYVKKGLLTNNGKYYAGAVVDGDISLPRDIVKEN
jgi:NAD(P)H-hydrate epimerase